MVLFAPARWFTAFVALLTVWGLYEVAAMFQVRDPVRGLILFAAGGGVALPMLCGVDPGWEFAAIVIVAALLNVLALARYSADRLRRNRLMNTVAASLWVAALFPYFALLRNSADGVPTVILLLLLVVMSDTGAYFAGKSFGSMKLAPVVSPNKTVEGAAGGLVVGVMGGVILWRLLAPGMKLPSLVFLAVCVGVLAQLGDLAGSAFKRIAGVKDSGWLFPGHGGLLDRTCSLVFAAVFTYYYLR